MMETYLRKAGKLIPAIFLLGTVLLGNVALAEGDSITGTLHIIWGDPPPATGQVPIQQFILIDNEGKSIPIVLDKKLIKSLGGVRGINRRRVTVKGQWRIPSEAAAARGEVTVFEVRSIETERRRDRSVAPQSGAATAPQGQSALIGSQPWVTILCRFLETPGITPHPSTWFDTLMGTTNPGMDHYWQELSYGNVDLTGSVVVGWYDLPQSKAYYLPGGDINGFWGRAAEDCSAAADADVNFPNFVGINFMFNESIGCCAWGGTISITADGGGTYSTTWMPPWGYQAHGVLAQEMGHGFGLPHSSGPYATPYDSLWDPMSNGFGSCAVPDPDYGCIGVHTISYHKDSLAWIPPARKLDISSSTQTIDIERLGQPTNGTDYLMVQIPIGGSATDFYTVEARRVAGGYDANIPGDAVIIHKVDTTLSDRNAQVVDATNNGDPNDAGAMWTVGETFTDAAYGISVTVNSDTGTGFNVTIIMPVLKNIFLEDFEGGFGNWAMTGLWNPENEADACGATVAPFPSSSNAAYYGIDGTCTYDTGVTNSGTLTLVTPVTLPPSGIAQLSFLSYEATEFSPDYDKRYIEVSTDNGATWTTLGTGDTEGVWYQKMLDLTPYLGSDVLIRFRFDTVDGTFNSNFGWMIDDVSIGVTAPPRVMKINSVADTGDGTVAEGELTSVSITQLLVTFDQDVADPAGNTDANDVTNPANYLLVEAGANASFDTVSCSGGTVADDSPVTVDSVSYSSGAKTATLSVNGGTALGNGSYRLHVCGTTSIENGNGDKLDGNGDGTGGDDFVRNFSVNTLTKDIVIQNVSALNRSSAPSATADVIRTYPSGKIYYAGFGYGAGIVLLAIFLIGGVRGRKGTMCQIAVIALTGVLLGSCSGKGNPDVEMTVSYNVINQGTDTVTATYREDVYLSTNTTLDGSDVFLGSSTDHTADLAGGGGSYAGSVVVTIPPGTAGTYYFLVQGDAGNAVAESDESNNVTSVVTIL